MCHNRGMKKIYDKNLINKVKEEYKIDNYFSKEYEFIGIEYEEDETMINPLEKTQYIQFVLEGTLLISFIDQEGRQTIVSQSEELCILGDMEFVYQSIEERFLYYLKYYCYGSLKSIEEATNYLHCSRRQLQRILKKLCDEGKMIKEGKGKYKIKG